MSLSKKLADKGTLRQVFYLSEAPPSYDPPLLPPPLHIRGRSILYLLTQVRGGGGEPTKEKVREAIVHNAGRKYKHD